VAPRAGARAEGVDQGRDVAKSPSRAELTLLLVQVGEAAQRARFALDGARSGGLTERAGLARREPGGGTSGEGWALVALGQASGVAEAALAAQRRSASLAEGAFRARGLLEPLVHWHFGDIIGPREAAVVDGHRLANT
jgi:hypothetical protein